MKIKSCYSKAVKLFVGRGLGAEASKGKWLDIVKWDQCKLIYITMPKTANTSIKTEISCSAGVLDESDKVALEEAPQRIHGILRDKDEVALPVEEVGDFSDYFVFSTVRNPLDRFVSFYKDKVLNDGWDEETTVDIFNTYGISKANSDEQNVRRICSFPDHLSEIHFRSQYGILTNEGRYMPDAVFRFEQMDLMWQILRGYASQQGVEIPPAQAHINKSSGGSRPDWLTPKIESIIRNRSARDAQFFGYS